MKTIKNFATILLLATLVTSCNNKYNLTGTIEGIGNDTIFVEYLPISQFYIMDEFNRDTIISNNDKFIFNSISDEPIMTFMFAKKSGFTRVDGSPYFPRHNYIVLLIKPNDQIILKGRLHDYYLGYEAKGSDFNQQYSQLRDGYIEEISQVAKIELQIDTLMSNNGDKELINNLFQERNRINSIASEIQLDYIKNNWDKELSAFYLVNQRLDTLGKYYENLNYSSKNGIFKNALDGKYLDYLKYTKVREAQESIVEGNIAPDFNLESVSGEIFNLGSINGKYIVLDFWGSWCAPCLQGFPKMKQLYNTYKNHLEIVGIACNDTEENWRKALKQYEIDWINVINNGNDLNKDASIMYAIQGYPTKIILNPNKMIEGIFYGEGDDFYNKIDGLLEN